MLGYESISLLFRYEIKTTLNEETYKAEKIKINKTKTSYIYIYISAEHLKYIKKIVCENIQIQEKYYKKYKKNLKQKQVL